MPHGYGKEILRGKPKLYLADPAISGSVLLRGTTLLEDNAKLGAAVETAFFKHVFTRYYADSIGFSYWRNSKTKVEVDIIAELRGELVPFEVKYTDRFQASDVRGLRQFCELRQIQRAYVITKTMADFDVFTFPSGNTSVLQIPAALACYWLPNRKSARRNSLQAVLIPPGIDRAGLLLRGIPVLPGVFVEAEVRAGQAPPRRRAPADCSYSASPASRRPPSISLLRRSSTFRR